MIRGLWGAGRRGGGEGGFRSVRFVSGLLLAMDEDPFSLGNTRPQCDDTESNWEALPSCAVSPTSRGQAWA